MFFKRIFFQWLKLMGISFLCFSYIATFADNNIDSLKSELIKAQGKEKIEILHKLTREYWSIDPEEAMKYAGIAYESSLASNDSTNMALALKNTGIIYYFTGENKLALNYYEKALKIFTMRSDKKGISSCVNNMGIIYKDLGNYEKALESYQKSTEIDYQLKDEEALASTLGNIGEIYHLQGLYDKAISYYKNSLALEIKYKNYDGIGESFMNIGAVYQENDSYNESMENYNYALVIFKKTGNMNRLALTCHNLGQLYYSLKDYYKSFIYANWSYKLSQELDNKQGLAASANLLAIVYEATGDEELANDYLFKAIILDLELGNKKKISRALSNKGNMLMKAEEYEQAVSFFLNSIEFARDISAWPELIDDYKYLSEAYFQLKDTTLGLYYDDLYRILADSMKSEAKGIAVSDTKNNDTSLSKIISDKSKAAEKVCSSKTAYYIIFSSAFVIFLIVFIFLLTQKRGRST